MSETFLILKKLIEIPSYVDGNHDEKVLIKYIKDFFEQKTSYKVELQPVDGERFNLLAYKKKNPKICLFGHMDTVLPKADTDRPFEFVENDSKIFGLGSVDMKSGLSVMLTLAQKYDSDELAFVFSVDEEFDFKGALMLKKITDFHPEYIVNVEPTDNKIINGCRGITEFSFVVHGKSAHAGRKEFGVNAIEKAVELVGLFQKDLSKLDLPDGGKSSVNLAYLHGGMLKSTENGVVELSRLGNVVPNYADVNCEIRIANSLINEKYIKEKLTELSTFVGVTVSEIKFKFMLGSMLTDKQDLVPFEKAMKENNIPVVYGDISLAGYYEVQMLQEVWGGKAIVFGAGPIDMSHKKNEYVEVDMIVNTEKCLVSFIEEMVK